MVGDDYGLFWFVAVPAMLATTGWAIGSAARIKLDATGTNDIAFEAQKERDKLNRPLIKDSSGYRYRDTNESDTVPAMMYVGAKNGAEAGYVSAFWLFRTARMIENKPGTAGVAQSLIDRGDNLYRKAYRGELRDTDRGIYNVFGSAAQAIYPWSPHIAGTLESLGSKYSSAMRRAYADQTGFTSTLIRPAAQSVKDTGEVLIAPGRAVGDAARAVGSFKDWINENKWLIFAGIGGLIIVQTLISTTAVRRAAKRASASSSPSQSAAPRPRRRRRS